MKRTKGEWLFLALCILLGLAGMTWFGVAIWDKSALHWNMHQPAYLKGVAELTVVFILLFLSLALPRRRMTSAVLTGLIAAASLFAHGFLWAFLAGCLYAGMICMTGRLLCRLLVRKDAASTPVCILLGIAGILILVAVCSVFKIGTPRTLRRVYAVVFLLELAFHTKPLLTLLRTQGRESLRRGERLKPFTALLLTGIFTAFLLQCCRANLGLDYDSMWYGLRSSAVLAPYTGIYDTAVPVSCVYVYPKGIETLALAFNFPHTYSFVLAVNLMAAALLLYVVYKTARQLCGRDWSLFAVLGCAVTAGIMNMAVTAKSDIATLLLQMLAVYFAVQALREKRSASVWMALGALVLSLCFKPSSMIFSLLLLLIMLVCFLCSRVRIRAQGIGTLLPPVLALGFLIARTYLLTGYFNTSFALGLQEALGCAAKYPHAGGQSTAMNGLGKLLTTSLFGERLKRLLCFFLAPTTEELDHVIIAWPGLLFAAVWLFVVIRVFSHPKQTVARMRENHAYAFSLSALALISLASMGSIMLLPKPDGNYFMLMYAMTMLHGAVELSTLKNPRTANACFLGSVPLIACGFALCLASSWAWSTGLTPIDLSAKGAYDHTVARQQTAASMEVDELCAVLDARETRPRVLIVDGEVRLLIGTDAVTDNWRDVTDWSNNELIHSPEDLLHYLTASGMDYLLVTAGYLGSENIRSLLRPMAEAGQLQIAAEQNGSYLLRFVPEGAAPDAALLAAFSGIQ